MDEEVVLRLPDDIHKLCRTCMSITENMWCHSTILIESSEKTLAGEMFQFCFSNAIESEDGLPKSICDDCANTLELVYNFKNQCEQTEVYLRKILNLPSRIKDIKQSEFIKTDTGLLNCEKQATESVTIHDNNSIQNYIDSTVEIAEDNEITVEELFQKIRDCSSVNNINNVTQFSQQSCGSSSSQADHRLIGQRNKHELNNSEEYNDIVLLVEERRQYDIIPIKQELISEDETDDEISCKICDEVFTNVSEYNNHSQFCNNKAALENIIKLENDSIDPLGDYEADNNEDILPHACAICGSKFKTIQGKTSHMAAHEKATKELSEDAPYRCDICSKIFVTETKLATHFYKHAAQIKVDIESGNHKVKNDINITCVICHENCLSKEHLKVHLKKHTKTGQVSCEICNKDFLGEVNLIRHLRKHGINILLCKICLKRFDNIIVLREHMKTHLIENIKNIFKCPICKAEFSEIESLKTHSVEHLNDIYECIKCKKTFQNKISYDNHEKQHIEPRFLCSLCGKQYYSSVTLASHIRAHNNEKPFICPHCKKGFSSRATLSVHKRIHSAFKPYVCSYCGYSCRQSGDLSMHIRTHTGDKPYKCTFPNCDRKFTTSSQRKEHYRRHTNERNHKCLVCGKAFLESKTLKVHMLVHTGAKPHACKICGKKFRRTHHLSNHMKGHKERIVGV